MKRHMVKKAIAFSLASLMAVNCSMTMVGSGTPWITGLTAHAAAKTSGTCGADLTWELDTAGVLTISGSGEMSSWESGETPWNDYASSIQKIVIGEGVTSIGVNAFSGLSNVTEAHIPDSVGKIDTGAFKGCAELLHVNMTPTDRVIVSTAFDGTAYAETYCTTEKSPDMNYGSAREMRGKQVVVNIFLNELKGELPNVETQKDEWEELPAETKKDFDNYDLENYYYDFFYGHVYKIPKEKLTYTLNSTWTQGFKETTENNAVAVSLDGANFVDYYKSSKNTFPEGDEFKGKYVYSDMMKQRLNLVESTLNQLKNEAAEYNVTDLEFISDTSLNYYFTYNGWNDNVETITFQSSDNIYENQIIGKRASITPTMNNAYGFSFCGTAKTDSNVMEQIKIATNGEIDLLRAETDEMSPFAQKLMEQYDADGVVVLFHMNTPLGRSYAKNTRNGEGSFSKTGEEFTVVYNNSVTTTKHEICHLYGAEDYYDDGLSKSNTDTTIHSGMHTFKMYCDTYFRNCPDMMYDDSNAYNALTAYTLGWYDMVEKDLLPLFSGGKQYYLGDIDMDGMITVADRKLLSDYIKGNAYLTPLQKVLAGEGLSPKQTIKGWTDKIKIQQMNNMQQYIQFIGVNPDTFMYTIQNDMNFDAVLNAADSELYYDFVSGARTPNYLQAMAMQYADFPELPDGFVDGKDNWSIGNFSKNFGDTYYMNQKYYNALMNGLSNTERAVIDYYLDYYDWGGSCYGLAATSILGYHDILDPQAYQANAGSLYEIPAPPSNEVKSLINYYWALQYTDPIQQKIDNTFYLDEEKKLHTLIECVEDRSPTLLGYHGYFPSGNLRFWSGHAVVAYDVEYGDYTWNGKKYDGKIWIYDNNAVDYNDEFCLYFSTTDWTWCIPYYQLDSTEESVLGLITDDLDYINYHGYLNGTSNVAVGDYIATFHSAALADGYQLTKAVKKNDLWVAGSANDDSIKRIASLTDVTVNEDVLTYAMKDATSSYILKTKSPESIDMYLKYENALLTAKAGNASAVTFSPNGRIELTGKDTDFELDIVLDEGYTVTDWYGMTVKGGKTDKAVLEVTEDGYLLTSDDLTDITVNGYHHDVSINAAFTTKYDSVLLHEIDEYTIGVSVDTDEDGVYEKLIAKSKPSVAGDLNNDGAFTVIDTVAFQKWLLTEETKIVNSRNADFCEDGVLDAFDLSIMKRKLLEK